MTITATTSKVGTTQPAGAEQAEPERQNPDHELIPVRLTATQELAPNLRRLTFHAPEFERWRPGLDEFFGLVMPQHGRQFEPFTVGDGGNLRSAVAAIPEADRPDLRWYTVRHHRPARAEIDVDVVTHGANGPGSRWVLAARPGMTAGLWTCSDLVLPANGPQLMVADASAAPALQRILEATARCHPDQLAHIRVLLQSEAPGELEPGFPGAWVQRLGGCLVIGEVSELVPALEELTGRAPGRPGATTLPVPEPGVETANTEEPAGDTAPAGRAGSAPAVDRSPEHTPFQPETVWASGESALVKAVRKLAVKSWGVPSSNVVWVPFWIRGRARP